MKRRISLRRAQKESTPVVTGTSMESGTKIPEEEDIGLNILQLPEMVMVDIFSFLPVKDKCRSTRAVSYGKLVITCPRRRHVKKPEVTGSLGCGRITNRDISPMSQLKNLEELSLLGCYRLGDQALEAITADHPNLKSLLIGHSDFTDVGMKDVALI
ncbi:hypothetical protein BSL78_16906 [Apostichopus japonicus]|uniref:Uncharacterized protein n=1 Tax=Stichopus japonicus TaxID=307972 RepID=A0A2G8KDZ2_STIJA|nr:hypothetical protein BSL78_16906 [Apostichopus japonicus]